MKSFTNRRTKSLVFLAILAANVAIGVSIVREAHAQNSTRFVCLRNCKCLGDVCSELGDIGSCQGDLACS